jgi:glyoxylase-like metal-dependent hydrolase (beta-lactamase superfamily II)
MTEFVEIAAGVHVLRYPVLDVNSTLILGTELAAVVDTLSTDAQAEELLGLVRRITPLPLVLINTHYHYDHCFGNEILAADSPATTIWAHEGTARVLREEGTTWQRDWYREWLETDAEFAEAIGSVRVRAPNRTVRVESIMDLGARTIQLSHLGRGHTEGDLVVRVPDADVLVAGDLVEEGAPPSFGESYPIEWPETVAAMLHLTSPGTRVVPGHGACVDPAFVRAQHADLTTLAWLIREAHYDGAPAEHVAQRAPFGAAASLPAVSRGYAELNGKI